MTRTNRVAVGPFWFCCSLPSSTARPALAQKPTFDIEGVVLDAQQAVLPGATVTVQNVSTGLTRTTATDQSGRYVVTALPPEGKYTLKVEIAGLRHRDPFEPGVQRRPARRAQLHAEAVERPGDGHRRRRVADGADDLVGGDVARSINGLREPAGQGAQLLPSPHARLQRRRGGNRLERGERRRRRGVELRHLRRRHEQPLEVADAAARAAARLERLRARDGQGSAAHHQPVLRRVRRTLVGRGQHDHQERHQRS